MLQSMIVGLLPSAMRMAPPSPVVPPSMKLNPSMTVPRTSPISQTRMRLEPVPLTKVTSWPLLEWM